MAIQCGAADVALDRLQKRVRRLPVISGGKDDGIIGRSAISISELVDQADLDALRTRINTRYLASRLQRDSCLAVDALLVEQSIQLIEQI